MFKRKLNKASRIQTLIGVGTRINGDVEFVGDLHLDGYVSGNVSATPGAGSILSVSEQGGIEGSVVVTTIVLHGIVKGDIDASDRVELGPNSRVLGNVHYTTLETAIGAQINGKLIHKVRSGADPP
jgi:cytoskeletal protein CcmA (bactofilin family)